MTCIVGYVENEKIYMGGDSAGVDGYDLTVRVDDKVFMNEDFIFGFTSSFRMGQILRYNFVPPRRKENITDEQYLYGDFINKIIEAFKEKYYAKIESNQIEGGTFLFGYNGKLYYVGPDFQIGRSIKKYDSIGCGHQYALGCLYALEKYELRSEEKNDCIISIKEKVEMALEAAEIFSTGVRRPFKIISK